MIRLLFLVIVLTSASTVAGAEWISLFDGKSLDGWKPTSEANWRVVDGAIVVDDGEPGFLLHDGNYENFELVVEYKASKGTNSGVFLNTKPKPKSLTADCYELNIAPPDNPFPTGSLVARKKYEGAWETDGWRKFEVRVEKGRVTVELDGEQVLDYQSKPPSSGDRIGLQFNKGRVAFRAVRVKVIE